MATFISSNLAGRTGRKQILFKQQRVYPVGIIIRNDFNHVVTMALVKRKRRSIVHCGFQPNHMAFASSQFFFGGAEQSRSYPMTPGIGVNIDRDNVADAAAVTFSHYEAEKLRTLGPLFL